MKKKIFSLAALLAAASLITFHSCKKVEDDVKSTSTSAENFTRAENVLGGAFDMVDDLGSTDGRLGKTGSTVLPSGATVNFSDSLFTDGDGVEYTVDFGAAPGLLCLDGRIRSGKVTITHSKPWTEVGCVVSTTLTNTDAFSVGLPGGVMQMLTGKITVTRTQTDQVNVVADGGKIAWTEGTTSKAVSFNSNKTITRTTDGGPGIIGDVFEVTGSGDGKNENNEDFSWTIKNKLVRDMTDPCYKTCSAFKTGSLELTSKNGAKYTIDFEPDNGACDNKVKVTGPGGFSKVFTIN